MKRIPFISSLLKGYDDIIDVGSDHGYVIKYAFDHNYIKHATATDINPLPLQTAKNNLINYNVDFILTDGLNGVTKKYDLYLICGMGARLIIDIIKSNVNINSTYLLSCNDKPHILRSFLLQSGYEIFDEYVIKDKHYYTFIFARKKTVDYNDIDILLGPVLRHKKDSLDYYQHILRINERLLDKVDENTRLNIETLINYLKETINNIKKLDFA